MVGIHSQPREDKPLRTFALQVLEQVTLDRWSLWVQASCTCAPRVVVLAGVIGSLLTRRESESFPLVLGIWRQKQSVNRALSLSLFL